MILSSGSGVDRSWVILSSGSDVNRSVELDGARGVLTLPLLRGTHALSMWVLVCLISVMPRANQSLRKKHYVSQVGARLPRLAAAPLRRRPVPPGQPLRARERRLQQVRFCRYRFPPTGELGYSGIRGAVRVRIQVHP